jgi:hypothetical protein
MSAAQRVRKRIGIALMLGTVLSVVGYGTAVAANVASGPLSDPENPNPSPSPGSAYTLTVHRSGNGHGSVTSTPSGIACGADCVADYGVGAHVTLTAHPAAGSHFGGWSGACSGEATCTVGMSASRSVTATFSKDMEKLTVDHKGHGSVKADRPGIHCGADCGQSYAHGVKIHVSAHEAAGWHFAGWKGACSGKKKCGITMNRDRHVVAKFAKNAR